MAQLPEAHDSETWNGKDDLQARLELLQQVLVKKQGELDSLRTLPRENKYLREKLQALNDRVCMLTAGWLEPVNGETISLRTRLLEYQRHSRVLQEELRQKEEANVKLRVKMEQQEEDLEVSRQRCSILFERLRLAGVVSGSGSSNERAGGDATDPVMIDEDDPSSFISVTRKLRNAAKEQELLQERLASMQEDYERRAVVMVTLQRENAALRASVSRLIQQVKMSTALQLAEVKDSDAPASPRRSLEVQFDTIDSHQKKLLTYHTHRNEKKATHTSASSKGD